MRDFEYYSRLKKFMQGKPHPSLAGWVYIFGTAGHPYYKIGMAKNINKRKSQMQGGSPWKLITVDRYYTKDKELVEYIFHNIFSHRKFYNEWFELKEEDFIVMENLRGILEHEN